MIKVVKDISSLDPRTVGFFAETAFHYEVYQSIIAGLRRLDVPCLLVLNDRLPKSFVDEMVEALDTFRESTLFVTTASVVMSSAVPLPCLVSPYLYAPNASWARLNVRALYGLAKDRWGHAWWNVFYDLILCYAPHSAKRLDIFGTTRVVGNPRFDPWYQSPPKDASAATAAPRESGRPSVLYAPTYGNLSSIPHWAKRLSLLRHRWDMTVKLHHGTLHRPEERHHFALMKKHFGAAISPRASALSLLEHADYVLTDNSGFLFDAIQAGKRTILLSWDGLESLCDSNETYSDSHSTDQAARTLLPEVRTLSELQAVIANEAAWLARQEKLAHWRGQVCDAFEDGHAGERAAREIAALLAEPERHRANFLLQSLRQQLHMPNPKQAAA